MTLGLRGILLIVAIVLFVVAALSNGDTAFNLLCIGLAVTAAALLVEELGGVGVRFGAHGGGGRQP
jgi:hypothetical protein